MTPSKETIEKMIEEKTKERESLPRFSIFGDDNWKSIDRELLVLKRAANGDFPTINEIARADDEIYDCLVWLMDESQSGFTEGYLTGFGEPKAPSDK